MDRTANLLGAAALRATDRMAAATSRAAGRAAQAPAALAAVERDPGLSLARLRVHVGLSQPATVRLVDRLVADGLVVRGEGRDARSLGLYLTPAGGRAVAAVRGARAGALDDLLAPLGERDRAALGALLERLLEGTPVSDPQSTHVCRLCDVALCRGTGGCPVDRAAGA